MGGGMYQCSLCNFTAHIKQSLTVHIQNHHLSPDKARSARRRNKVGASDQLDLPISSNSTASIGNSGALMAPTVVVDDVVMDPDEMELLRMERMEQHHADEMDDEDGEAIGGLLGDADDEDAELKLNCGLQMTFQRLLGAAGLSEAAGLMMENGRPKKARPVPNLIPIGQAQTAPTILKIPQLNNKRSWAEQQEESGNTSPSILEAVGLLAKSSNQAVRQEDRTKKSRFLDQLAQKLAKTNEPPVPPPPPALPIGSISWSSRCQHCRQRCKTRADLLSHLKQCPKALEAAAEAAQQAQTAPSSSEGQQHHPMENKVFVWNNPNETDQQATPEEESTGSSGASSTADQPPTDVEAFMALMMEVEATGENIIAAGVAAASGHNKRPSSVAGSDISEASLVGIETAPGIGAVTGGTGSNAAMTAASSNSASADGRATIRRVYRCPQCSFWATTASRFHVHMVGHTNTKPFECSQCSYRSNWR